MAYRRTEQVIRRLMARRQALLKAARDIASEGGIAAVQIAPVARRARIAAGTVYRYFPSKADLLTELISDVSRAELGAVRRAANAAPGPLSALAAAIAATAVQITENRRLAWAVVAEPVDVDVSAARQAARGDLAAEISARIAAAIRAGQLPAQDAALTAAALIGALHEGLIGPLAPGDLGDPNRKREAIQSMTLCALRAVGIVDARARGLVVQMTVPAATPSG
jgi:AcrR family transcriptional regulator